MKIYLKSFIMAFLAAITFNSNCQASSGFSVNMQIPSWYERNEEDITYVGRAISTLVAYYGVAEKAAIQAKARGAIGSVLSDKKDWPSAIIAFKNMEDIVIRKYKEVASGVKEGNLQTQKAVVRDLIAVKKEFGVK